MEPQLEQIKKLLDSSKIKYELSEHEPVYTSEQAARVRGVPLSSGVKSIIIKTEEGKFYCILIPGDKKMNTKKLQSILHTKKISFAKPEEVLERTGCEIGSVHPFGNLMHLPTCMDRKLLENETVNFNVGLHTHSIAMKSRDLIKVVKPKLEDFST